MPLTLKAAYTEGCASACKRFSVKLAEVAESLPNTIDPRELRQARRGYAYLAADLKPTLYGMLAGAGLGTATGLGLAQDPVVGLAGGVSGALIGGRIGRAVAEGKAGKEFDTKLESFTPRELSTLARTQRLRRDLWLAGVLGSTAGAAGGAVVGSGPGAAPLGGLIGYAAGLTAGHVLSPNRDLSGYQLTHASRIVEEKQAGINPALGQFTPGVSQDRWASRRRITNDSCS